MIALTALAINRVRMFAFAAIAAATLALGSLTAAAPASAMMYTCTEARDRFETYIQVGDYWASRGNYGLANFYYHQAQFVANNTYCP
jgi:hypothetical protein